MSKQVSQEEVDFVQFFIMHARTVFMRTTHLRVPPARKPSMSDFCATPHAHHAPPTMHGPHALPTMHCPHAPPSMHLPSCTPLPSILCSPSSQPNYANAIPLFMRYTALQAVLQTVTITPPLPYISKSRLLAKCGTVCLAHPHALS